MAVIAMPEATKITQDYRKQIIWKISYNWKDMPENASFGTADMVHFWSTEMGFTVYTEERRISGHPKACGGSPITPAHLLKSPDPL